MSDPMDQLRALGQRIKYEAEQIGLSLYNLAFIPGPNEGDPNMVQAVFIIKPEAIEAPAPEKDPDQDRIDAEFAEMMRAEKSQTDKDTVTELGNEVQGWLDEGNK